MADTTLHDTAHGPRPLTREMLRATLPPLVAVLMLFGVLVGGALLLREVVDVGVWLVSAP